MSQAPQAVPQQALYGYDVASATAPPAPHEPVGEQDGQRLEASLIANRQASDRACVAKALCAHSSAIAVANVIVWTIYFAVSPYVYPWPMWVTFGTVLSVAAHAINVLPWTSPRPRKCPRHALRNLNVQLHCVQLQVVADCPWQYCPCKLHCVGGVCLH
eukprot:symbB.v1.2.016224.t1/scaffold1230.1/size216073/4